MPSKAKATVTTDHDEIKRWAEERGAKPACVRKTGDKNDLGILRLDFPGYSGEDSLEPVEWDDWFEKFDEMGLALLHQETTARGQKSNFNKLISRETAMQNENGASHSGKQKSSAAASSKSRSAKPAASHTSTRASSTARGPAAVIHGGRSGRVASDGRSAKTATAKTTSKSSGRSNRKSSSRKAA